MMSGVLRCWSYSAALRELERSGEETHFRETGACAVNVLSGRGLFSSLKHIDDIVVWGPISRRPESHLKPQTRD